MENKIAGIDWSQFDLERELRGLNEKQKEERIEQIVTIKELEKTLKELEKIIKRKGQERRQRKEEETDR